MISTEPCVYVIAAEPAEGGLPEMLAAAGLPCACYPAAQEFVAACPAPLGCLVCDARVARDDVLLLAERLALRETAVALILITEPGNVTLAVQAMERGVMTVLTWPVAASELASAVRRGLHLAARRRAWRERWAEFDEHLARLTRPQRHFLELLVSGKSNEQIARQIGKSVRTVDRRRRALLQQMDVDSVVELAYRFACWRRGPFATGRGPRRATCPRARGPRSATPD